MRVEHPPPRLFAGAVDEPLVREHDRGRPQSFGSVDERFGRERHERHRQPGEPRDPGGGVARDEAAERQHDADQVPDAAPFMLVVGASRWGTGRRRRAPLPDEWPGAQHHDRGGRDRDHVAAALPGKLGGAHERTHAERDADRKQREQHARIRDGRRPEQHQQRTESRDRERISARPRFAPDQRARDRERREQAGPAPALRPGAVGNAPRAADQLLEEEFRVRTQPRQPVGRRRHSIETRDDVLGAGAGEQQVAADVVERAAARERFIERRQGGERDEHEQHAHERRDAGGPRGEQHDRRQQHRQQRHEHRAGEVREPEHRTEHERSWPLGKFPQQPQRGREQCRERHLGQAFAREAQRPRRDREREPRRECRGVRASECPRQPRGQEHRRDVGDQRGQERDERILAEEGERHRIERGHERVARKQWIGRPGGRTECGGVHERRHEPAGLEPSPPGQCILGAVEAEASGIGQDHDQPRVREAQHRRREGEHWPDERRQAMFCGVPDHGGAPMDRMWRHITRGTL